MRLLIAAWLVFLTALSLMPVPMKEAFGTTGQFHNAGHFLAFAITAVIFCWSASSLPAILARAFNALAVGLVLELLEHLGYSHVFEWKDVLTDALGVCAGLVIIFCFPNCPAFQRLRRSTESADN